MTGTAKHTPGPWGCVDTSNHAHDYRLTKPNGDLLPVNASGNDHSEQRANAKLIAAAPDMLAALKTAKRFVGAYQLLLERGKNASDARFAGESFDECARAIAKAEGRDI